LITDKGLKALFSTINLNGKYLNSLNLNFTGCSRISDRGITKITKHMRSFKNLQHLNLNFYECYLITNDGAKELYNSILQHMKLQSLLLDFSWCDKITNDGLQPLVNDILNLKLLKIISLKFYGCPDISLKDVTKLISNLSQNFNHLQQVMLNFDCFDEMEEDELIHFKNTLHFAQNIQLNFD